MDLAHVNTIATESLNKEPAISIQQIQEKDRDLNIVKKWLEKNEQPSFCDIGKYGFVVKCLWSQWKDLRLKDSILYRESKNDGTLCVVIPFCERRRILQHSHDEKTSAHLGVRKTLARIKRKYYWPGIRRDVKVYIAGCEACSKRKGPLQRKRAPMKTQTSGYPMERIAADILGELPNTNDGNKYILVISDYFTKWTEAHTMPNMAASTVADIIVREVVTRFGVPTTIHSDQGSQFESELFTEMCQLLQINKTKTTPYHPKSDGMVERFNKTLATMLSSYVNEHHTNWDILLPYVMMAYRSAEHETTGCTPNRLMLGREVMTPLDLIYEPPVAAKLVPRHAWAWELQDRIEEAHRIVQEHVEGEILRQKKYHDQKLSWEQFSKGDKVLVFFPIRKPGRSPKFTSYWRGPFSVLKKNSDWTYLVNCGRGAKSQVIHVDRMRRCKPQKLFGEIEQEAQPSADAYINKEQYEVMDGAFDPEAGITTVAETQDDALPHAAAWTESEISRRPRRNRKSPVWLRDYDQHW